MNKIVRIGSDKCVAFSDLPITSVEESLPSNTTGLDEILNSGWILWDNNNINSGQVWSTDKLVPMLQFNTVAGFWKAFDSTDFSEGKRFTFMRKGIKPMWEDPHHIGGAFIKIDLRKFECDFKNIFMYFILGIVGESLTHPAYDSLNITGITLLNEPRGKQIKIWIKNSNLELTKCALDQEYESLLPTGAELTMVPFNILMLKHIRKIASGLLTTINTSKSLPQVQTRLTQSKSSRNVKRKRYFYKRSA